MFSLIIFFPDIPMEMTLLFASKRLAIVTSFSSESIKRASSEIGVPDPFIHTFMSSVSNGTQL